MSRASKAALLARQLEAGDKAQSVFEALLEPKNVECPECGAVVVGAKYDNLSFAAAKETMSAIGLGPVSRQKLEDDDRMDLKGAIGDMLQAIQALPEAERNMVIEQLTAMAQRPLIELS